MMDDRGRAAAAAYANPDAGKLFTKNQPAYCNPLVSPIAESSCSKSLGSYRITDTDRLTSRRFRMYLAKTHACRFHIKGNIMIHGVQQPHEKEILYIHRWTSTYRKSVIKKFYQLEEWWKENPMKITLLTLTTYQDGKYSQDLRGESTSINEAFDMLKRGWLLVSKWLRKHFPGVQYVWVIEPHKSGYPHIHAEIFCDLPVWAQDKIRSLWSEKYKFGSAEHGVNFVVRPDMGIVSVKNYLLKHIAKTLVQGKTGSKFEDGTSAWTEGELFFNAVCRQSKWRLWGASLALSKVMARRKPGRTDYEWVSTELLDENGDTHLVGKATTTAPDADACIGFDPPVVDPDDLCPENMTTRALWSRGFYAAHCAYVSQNHLNAAYGLK